MKRKRVRVGSLVAPEDPEPENQKEVVSHPSILSFGPTLDVANADQVRVSMMRPTPTEQDGKECITELIAREGKSEWRGKKARKLMSYDHFIGVRNNRTNVIQLFRVDGVYTMRPLTTLSRNQQAQPQVEEEEEKKTYGQQKEQLLRSFGAKKSQRRIERYKRDRITEDKVDEKAQEQLTLAAREMVEKDAKMGIHHDKKQTTEKSAPPHDSTATNPKDAYPIEGLMTATELKALEYEAHSMLDAFASDSSELSNPGWHQLVWQKLIEILRDEELSEEDKILRMQAIMHLHYLIIMAKCPKRILREEWMNLMEEMAVEETVLRHILDRFTVEDGMREGKGKCRRKSDACIPRITVYGILMWLIACGYENCTGLGRVAEALNVSLNLLLAHALRLGCKVKRNKNAGGKPDPEDYRLSLPVPLKFPELKMRRTRTGKRG